MYNKALAKGITKISLIVFALALVGFFVLKYVLSVFAAHNATITITPNIANCDELGNTFTVNVHNNGPDKILQVEIYKALTGISNFSCGPAPTGWSYLPWPGEDRCIYVTGLQSAYKIAPGSSLNFTFDAVMSSDACQSVFTVATVDDAYPVGDRKTYNVTVDIDCVPPVIYKTVGEPKIPGTEFDWWVTSNTKINITATDNDECDLGLDYCKWRVTVDGTVGEWNYEEDGEVISWDVYLIGDSNHYLEVECYDIAGNKFVLLENDKVDNTPPTTIKSVSQPKKVIPGDDPEEFLEWVDSTTEITLNSEDPDPTGYQCNVGVEKIWYRNDWYSDGEGTAGCYDPYNYCNEEWYNIDSPYDMECYPGCIDELQEICLEAGPHGSTEWFNCMDEGLSEKCGITGWKLYRGDPITKNEESCHVLSFFSVDYLGNKEDINMNCFFVDKTPPRMMKEVGEPSYYESSRTKTDTLCYKDAENDWQCYTELPSALEDLGYDELPSGSITYEDYGPFLKINVQMFGLKPNKEYQLTLNGRNGNDGNDELANNCPNPNAPAPGYQYAWECGYWIGGTGQEGFWNFDMKAKTNGSGDYEKTYFLFMPDGHYGIGPTHEFGVGFIVKEAADAPGGSNYPPILMEYHGLDWTINKEQPVWVRDINSLPGTPITLNCQDIGFHPSDDEEVCYKVSYDLPEMWTDITEQYCPESLEHIDQDGYEGDWCCVPAPKTITFMEDSLHDLEWFCRDAVDKKSPIDTEYFKVDSQPPVITKTMIGDDHLGDCPPEYSPDGVTYICYVKDSEENGVHISVIDNQTYPDCAVNNVWCRYHLWWETTEEECKRKMGPKYEYSSGWCKIAWDGFDENADVIFTEDSKHKLYIHCEDALGNVVDDTEYFEVDSTPPVTTKTYGEPTKVEDGYRWITSSTPINLTATDGKVGVDSIRYRYCLDTGCYGSCECSCEGKPWIVVEDNSENDTNSEEGVVEVIFTIPEDSEHCIEYQAEDKLRNEEETHSQCVYVDNIPPIGTKEVGDPSIPDVEFTWVTQNTPITLDCEDQDPHPVDQESVCFKVSFEEGYLTEDYCTEFGGKMEKDWCCVYVGDRQLTIHFLEDTLHDLEYYCIDYLGNAEEPHPVQWYRVDTTPPETTKEIIGPQFYNETEEKLYINGITKISLTCTDKEEPCAVGKDNIQYRYRVREKNCGEHWSEWTDWFVYEEPFSFPEECYHELEYYCNDTLGNEEEHHHQFYYVDKTPPVIEKWYEGPEFYEDDSGYPKWISSETNVTMNAYDSGPHPSGVKEVKYRITLVDDENCWNQALCQEAEGLGDWTLFNGIFKTHIEEGSCHLIEIKAKDNVDKESYHKQCVFVDNTPPIPNKTVGEPKTKWDGKDANFYDIADKCWSEDPEKFIECWKVTLFTPVYLDCEDQGEHPVNHEKTCFKVEVDGDDATSEYCRDVKGNYNETSGFCCGLNAPFEFRFNEETEHNLKYYCVDVLGNKGPIDEEKFKVEGTTFRIQLNKKWNLISVPFVMLNDSIDDVFKDVAEDIESVWTYDAEANKWYVYTPNDGPDSLHEMKPGWGYWVKAKNDTTLLIGGSLFSPAKTPPEKKVVHGWNLIGYFGTDGETVYDGPDGDGKPVYCALFSLIDTVIGFPRWSSLVTYWEPDNPDQWKYFDLTDSMDPGAGYWLEMDVNDTYTFTTTCGLIDLWWL